MKLIRTMIALTLACLLVSGAQCSKSSLLSNADDVLFSLRRAQPLIASALPGVGPKISQAVSLAERLRAAVAANNSTDAVSLLNQIVPIFSEIVEKDIVGLDPHTRTQIMAALAIADISLHLLVRRFLSSATAAQARSVEAGVLRAFDSKKVWGTAYKRN